LPFPTEQNDDVLQRLLRTRPLAALAALSLGALGAGAAPGRAGAQVGNVAAIWANDGGDKVTRDELRASRGGGAPRSRGWDGRTVRLDGARNEVVAFNLVLEAPSAAARRVSVTFDRLTGPGGATIRSKRVAGDGVFDWRGRDIELFYVRYLQIKGISRFSYEGAYYDERHAPTRMRRPFDPRTGQGRGRWTDRPGHDKFYPDIAVPLDLVPAFTIAAGTNQSVWADVYIPKGAPPGRYTGAVRVAADGQPPREVPVELTVRPFTLPDVPAAKTMLYVGDSDLERRYLAPTADPRVDAGAQLARIHDRHFQVAHRHRVSVVTADPANATLDRPGDPWLPRLSGTLFTASRGYAGPGVGVGNGIYSIGTYAGHKLPWMQSATAARPHADAWVRWFERNARGTEYFIYLIDESRDYAQTERWASSIARLPSPGNRLPTFATLGIGEAVEQVPSLTIAASSCGIGLTERWAGAVRRWRAIPGKRFYCYNSGRPATGSIAVEDDGVALRELAWAHYKLRVDRWFFWESTYYTDVQGGRGSTNVFQTAATFSGPTHVDSINGETGYNHTNGDGVFFYPGTDRLFPRESYGVGGPIASLRLKQWRRGLQDVDYLALAARVSPARVAALVKRMVPKAAWEYGVDNPEDPTYVHTDISWSTNPDAWDAARAELAAIIEGGQSKGGGGGGRTTPPPPRCR
jgi:hypothetical protein